MPTARAAVDDETVNSTGTYDVLTDDWILIVSDVLHTPAGATALSGVRIIKIMLNSVRVLPATLLNCRNRNVASTLALLPFA